MLAKSHTHINEIKDQQCKATIIDCKPRRNPATPAGQQVPNQKAEEIYTCQIESSDQNTKNKKKCTLYLSICKYLHITYIIFTSINQISYKYLLCLRKH
jgi:hypothetical protein